MHQSSFNDMPIHKFIPMEKFDLIRPNDVRILYYQSPSRFYVYLPQKISIHAKFQVELQRAMQNYQTVSSPPKYQRHQSVVAQDNHTIWHRATILDFNSDSTEIRVYFVDVGQEENISITNIRPLPSEFIRQPAFAIPCRLYGIYPLNGNEQSIWKLNDPVHDEFNRLMANNASCKVCDIKEEICYDVEVDIPEVGDLGTFLFEKKLVSRINMRTTQPPQQSVGRIPPGFSAIQPPPTTTRLLQKPIVQQSPSSPTTTDSSSDISTLPLQDGHYIITHVYNAIEFYGHSQIRKKELDALHKHLEMIYNNNTNDQSLSVHFLMDGVPCAIQQGEQYHRVIIKHRESESRVLVKLVDRGDEILVDTSELLQLEKKYFTIPAFAQPFRLYNYDESHSTPNITRKLKRLILNQRVSITQHSPIINGFYQVEVKLSDNQSVNQILLSNDINPIVCQSNSPPIRPIEVQTTISQRINEDLPAPQKLLTAPLPPPAPAPTIHRFTSNEQTSRFSRPQQQEKSNSPVNGHPPLMPELNGPYNRGFSTDRNGNNNRGGRNGFGDRNNDENGGQRTGGFNNNRAGGFGDRNNDENSGQRTGGFSNSRSGGFGDRNNDENSGQRTGGFNNNRAGGFGDRNNDENGGQRTGGFSNSRAGSFGDRNNDENSGQRTGGFNNNNRGSGFGDRGNRNGFSDRNYENRNENSGQRTGGFNNNNRGARNGDFQDRNNRYRNNQDDDNNDNNNTQRFGNRGGYNGERRDRNGGGGFQSFRDRGDDREGGGDNGRRGGFGDRGGPRGGRGGFSDRGNRGGGSGRGGRPGGFGDRNENGFRPNSDNNDSVKTFSGWPNVKSTANYFEAGDHFIENEIPKESFQFVLSHIEKSNDFFIQLYSKEKELSQLTDTLQIEYKDAPELNTNSIKINQVCLAKHSDSCWYRAIILTPGLTKIKVRFIDFGDTLDVDTKSIRQLAKKFCLTSPYAYRCTLNNVENNENISTNEIIDKCQNEKFNGKIENKTSDNKYILQSENFEKLMIDIKAIKKKYISCLIVYIDSDKHQFYIQDDPETMEKINNEVNINDEISSEEINLNSMVISTYEDAPYRAIIQSDLDENVSVYFVDYGNTNICLKTSLKKCNEQLKTYPYQAKRCQLYDVSINDLDQAFKQLEEYIEYDKTEISFINQNDHLFYVRLYIDNECFNDKFQNEISIDLNDQSSTTTTATTVKEQEQPISLTGKRNNEEILSPVGNSLSQSTNIKRQKSESETEGMNIKYHQGILTHIDKNKPNVYLQLLPESESNLERINELIDTIIQEDKRNSSYEIGDYIIAQFTEDNNHYRARIESYSSSTELYTVYFIDYGNLDENVPKNRLYSYSNELKEIEPQVHIYTLENLSLIRSLIEEKLNDTIEFYFIDKIHSIIHFKFDHNIPPISNQPKTFTANISGTNKDCFYIHILPDTDTLICEMDELLQSHTKEHNQINQWNINDLCIYFDNQENQYFRGKILSINNEQYDIQCIDYGNIISNITNDQLYLLTNNNLIKQNPLARQCRLYGVNDNDQSKAIEEIIKNINPTERVTITVENDQNDQCMFVMLFRDNHEIVNDRYIKQEIKTTMSTNSSDSAIDTTNDQQVTSPIGIPQAESTHQYGDTTNLTVSTINQTIDFGENDPSTSNSTITDEIENE